MVSTLLIILIPLLTIGVWFWKWGAYIMAKYYAAGHLESLLFSNGSVQREAVITSMSKITKDKYSREDLLDYFVKIKGLQVVNIGDPIDFWTRKYLTSPTKLKLNYFEQVKFYETFLNYPTSSCQVDKAPQQGRSEDDPKGLFYPKKQFA